MDIANLGLAALAGLLSTLSPCVLPLLPIILGSAAAEHRFAPAALAAGVAISFACLGLLVATLGFAAGFDSRAVRTLGALLLAALGLAMLSPALWTRLSARAGSVSDAINRRFNFSSIGLGGQFSLGLLLGTVWTPCVGPTLGAASLLASRGESLSEVALTMTVFGLAAALPLLALGWGSREAMLLWRSRLSGAEVAGKRLLGALVLSVALLVLTGYDKTIEAKLVALSPDWLTNLTTRY